MPIDIAALAATVVSSFLLPVAKKTVNEIRERLSQDVSATAADEASSLFTRVWERVKGMFRSDSDRVVIEQFEKRPEVTAPLVEEMLAEKLAAEPAVAEELRQMVEQPVPGMAGGTGMTMGQVIAQTAGFIDARGAHISGVAAGVVLNAPPPPKPTMSQPPADG